MHHFRNHFSIILLFLVRKKSFRTSYTTGSSANKSQGSALLDLSNYLVCRIFHAYRSKIYGLSCSTLLYLPTNADCKIPSQALGRTNVKFVHKNISFNLGLSLCFSFSIVRLWFLKEIFPNCMPLHLVLFYFFLTFISAPDTNTLCFFWLMWVAHRKGHFWLNPKVSSSDVCLNKNMIYLSRALILQFSDHSPYRSHSW